MSRAYANYAQNVTLTPQTQPIAGRESEMIANNAGGYGFIMDDWFLLERFLVLGSFGGSYYVGEQKLTAQNAGVAIRCIKADGQRAVEMAREINVSNRAPKVDQQLFLLALALKHGDQATKTAVAAAVPKMIRTGTHLLHFVAMLDGLGGWNRSKRRLIADWFTKQDVDRVAFQVLKYQNRDGFTMRDVLRLTHPLAILPEQNAVFAWICGKLKDEDVPHLRTVLANHRAMSTSDGSLLERALWGIAHGLPREALPTEVMNDPEVQRALLPSMPLHALIRNLGNLTASGVVANGSPEAATVAALLTDRYALLKARVHPFAILLATLVYRTGAGVRGSKTWTPVPAVLSALEDAYDAAFASVKPTGKRMLVAIDISYSMIAQCMGSPVAASTAAVAMAITLARLEPNALVVQFDKAVQAIVPVTKRTGIAGLVSHNGGGTDLGAPIQWASRERIELDAFVILTDNETWAGNAHMSELLTRYRKVVSPRAKLVICAMTANHASVVDPTDPLSFGCAGLDANLPVLVSDFISR